MIQGDDGAAHGDQHVDYSPWSSSGLKPIICFPPALHHLSLIQNIGRISNTHTQAQRHTHTHTQAQRPVFHLNGTRGLVVDVHFTTLSVLLMKLTLNICTSVGCIVLYRGHRRKK